MSYTTDNKLQILLTEYQTLKDENKQIFSFQFTLISIWIAFLGVMIGILFNQFNAIEEYSYGISISHANLHISNMEYFKDSRDFICLLTAILIPGAHYFFALIWLDLTTRFIKEAHYIFLLEEKIKSLYDDFKGFDHFLFEETQKNKGLKKTNYLYYCFMLGLLLMCPILIIIFNSTFNHIYDWKTFHVISFCILTLFTFICVIFYLRRILSYTKEKEDVINPPINK